LSKTKSISYYSKPIAQIHADFGGICVECGEYVELKDASRDHIIPRAKGGGNGRENINLTHKKCNNMKGDEVRPDNWREQLKRKMTIPKGYICSYCSLEIKDWHKKKDMVSQVFRKGNLVALHSWCNLERVKYGKR